MNKKYLLTESKFLIKGNFHNFSINMTNKKIKPRVTITALLYENSTNRIEMTQTQNDFVFREKTDNSE